MKYLKCDNCNKMFEERELNTCVDCGKRFCPICIHINNLPCKED